MKDQIELIDPAAAPAAARRHAAPQRKQAGATGGDSATPGPAEGSVAAFWRSSLIHRPTPPKTRSTAAMASRSPTRRASERGSDRRMTGPPTMPVSKWSRLDKPDTSGAAD